jgi:GntR family transcriptional regulator
MPEIERSRPPYLQVARHIGDQVTRSEIGPGDRVPSAREIAATWKIAQATADKALQMLRMQGLVETQPGVSTVVRRNPPIYRTAPDRQFEPLRRRASPRLAGGVWGAERAIWAADAGDRECVVDQVEVGEEPAGNDIAGARHPVGFRADFEHGPKLRLAEAVID